MASAVPRPIWAYLKKKQWILLIEIIFTNIHIFSDIWPTQIFVKIFDQYWHLWWIQPSRIFRILSNVVGSNPYFWRSHSRKGINPVANLGLMLRQLQQRWLTVTWCTVQPESLTPASNTCSWAFIPLNEGSSEGCTFSKCPLHLRTNLPIKQRNKQKLNTLHVQRLCKLARFFTLVLSFRHSTRSPPSWYSQQTAKRYAMGYI